MFSGKKYILSNINTLNNTDNIIINISIYYDNLYKDLLHKLKKYYIKHNIKILSVNANNLNNDNDNDNNAYSADMYIFLTNKINITQIKNLKKKNKYIIVNRNVYTNHILSSSYPGLIDLTTENKDNIYDYIVNITKKINYTQRKAIYYSFKHTKKILFVSTDIVWNKEMGNSIWATNFIKILKLYNNINIDICVVRKLSSVEDIFIFNDLKTYCNIINLFNSYNFYKYNNYYIVKLIYIINYIKLNYNKYDLIVIRNEKLAEQIINVFNTNNILDKFIYIQKNNVIENTFIGKFKNIINMTFLEYFNNKSNNKYLIPPLLINSKKITSDIIYDFCIVGTLHTNSGLSHILNFFSNTHYKIIIAGMCSDSYKNEFNELYNRFNTYENIIFNVRQNGISDTECIDIISKSKVCIRIDKLYECLSSKLLNYINQEKPCIIQKTKTHELLFGYDYPLFLKPSNYVDPTDLSNIINISIDIINNEELYNKLINNIILVKRKLDPTNLVIQNYSLSL